MNNLPIIRDPLNHFTTDCTHRQGGTKELHRVARVPLTRSVSNDEDGDVLQDEAGFPILDEQTSNFIYDDLKA